MKVPSAAVNLSVPEMPGPSTRTSALGIGSTLLNGTGASLGYGGAVSPIIAGWGPTLLLAVIAAVLAARVGGQGMRK